MKEIKILKEIIEKSEKLVFFGGAGVSTESGIPDFRSAKGLYSEKYRGLQPEEIISHSFFVRDPKLFYDYYREHLVFPDAKPNDAHKVLAELEKQGKDITVVTQNIDSLHQMAGSTKVYELHGTVHKNTCLGCGAKYALDTIISTDNVPKCPKCGETIKPDVVLYEESLPYDAIEGSIKAISEADTMIIAGTSLAVYPAAGFIRYFRGNNLVVINLSETQADDMATLVIHDKVGEVLKQII